MCEKSLVMCLLRLILFSLLFLLRADTSSVSAQEPRKLERWIWPSSSPSSKNPSILGYSEPRLTVSGFSAGGSMAIQLYLAYSGLMKGVAVFSGLLYQCGEGYGDIEAIKLLQCSRGNTDVFRTKEKIRQLSVAGLLDPLENLATRRHFIEHGRYDSIVRPSAGKVIKSFFEQYSKNVNFVELPHSHAAPTMQCGARCSIRITPFSGFVSCGYSAAFEGLNYIYEGKLVQPTDKKIMRCHLRDDEVPNLFGFNQKEFFPPGEPSVGMADVGFIYVPYQCHLNSSLCSLHIHFHGCLNDAMLHGKGYIKNSELLAIADANNLVVVFPQTTFVPNSLSGILQCWDLVGVTEFGTDYWGTKKGRQLSVIYKIIERIMDDFKPRRPPIRVPSTSAKSTDEDGKNFIFS